jgi:hypothetical protein
VKRSLQVQKHGWDHEALGHIRARGNGGNGEVESASLDSKEKMKDNGAGVEKSEHA